MATKIYVIFKIVSDVITPEKIEEITGLQCDYKWRIGDKRGKTMIIEKTNGFVIESKLAKTALLREQLFYLLDMLTPYAQSISALPKETYREIACVIYSEDRTEMFFNEKIINQIANLNACFGIDYYSFDP